MKMPRIFKDKNDSHEFKPLLVEIEESPANPLGGAILYIIIALVIFAILYLSLAKIDIVVSANGKIVPDSQIKIIKPLESGIVSKILVREGQSIEAGEPLIIIDSNINEGDLKSKKLQLDLINLDISRLNALSYDTSFETTNSDALELYTTQKLGFETRILAYDEEIDFLGDREAKLGKVKDIIAKKDYESTIFELAKTKKERENYIKESRANWLNELQQKHLQATELIAQINEIEFRKNRQMITSPVGGFVGKLLINTEQTAISSGDELLSIIPSDEKLVVRANVLNKDIGYLKYGLDSAIKVETFSFQKYGKLDGTLTHIAKDSIKDEKLGEVFEVKIEPKQTHLIVDGEKKQIEVGMNVVAEIKVGKRRIIELFIYPVVKYLDEGIRVR